MNKGIDYKYIFTPTGKTNIVTGAKLVQRELELLFSISKHELFFGNDIGFDAEAFLGLTNREATFNLIKASIEELFMKYGKATLNKVTMTFINGENTVVIDLDVTTGLGRTRDTFSLNLEVGN